MGSAAAGRRGAAILLVAFALTPAAFSAGASEQARAAGNYGKLPLSFEENRGQTDPRVKYISRGSGYALFLTPTDAVLSLTGVDRQKKSVSTSLRMSFVDAHEASLSGADLQASHSSYFIGSDKNAWRTKLRHFGRVRYKGVYPGIDAVFYGNQRQLEYDFIVAPGADPKQIRLRFEGARSVMTASSGDLVLRTALGDVHQLRPIVYQESGGRRRIIESRYKVDGNEATFEFAAYDTRKPLVIDPVLAWSTFWGGTGTDVVNDMVIDPGGSLLLTGLTSSADFKGAIQFIGVPRGGASDAFVTKLNATGGSAVWSAYFGGTGADFANAVATDADGSVYITGSTDSGGTDPTNPGAGGIPLVNAQQTVIGGVGTTDAFVAKIASDASALIYSTYFGGFHNDAGMDIAVNSDKQAVFVGFTESTNFPAAPALFGTSDAFVTMFSATGTARVWSRFIGGFSAETAHAVAIDSAKAVYVTGSTNSFSFPVTAGVVQSAIGSTNQGGSFLADAFVMKISSAGATVYSTFLGGSAFDIGLGIAVDSGGNAYIFGDTESPNFPTTSPLQSVNQGNRDTFITKLNPTASARVYSTFLGGGAQENAGDIVLLGDSAHVVGSTLSTNFPIVGATQIANGGGFDVFVAQVNPAGTALAFSTYLGGVSEDRGNAIAVSDTGNIYVAGSTTSTNFPVPGAAQAALAGIQDGFIAKLANCAVTLSPTLPGGAPGSAHSFAASSGIITVTGPSDCTWNPQTNVSWITLVNASATAGNGTLSFSVAANTGAPRTGTITIAGVQYTVQQAGAPLGAGCLYPIEPTGIIALADGVSGTFVVGTSNSSCNWTATSDVRWLQMFPGSGNDTTTLRYTVFPNFSTSLRIGVITVTAQGVSRTFTVTQANSFLTEPERFVTLLYSNFMGRYPRADEIAFQTATLLSGVSRGSLAANFFNATEFLQGGRFVTGLYIGLLGRDPEFGGWLFQRNALALNIVSQEQLVSNFINSAEFNLKYGTLTNEQFVTILYQNILGRTPDPLELAFHAAFLNTGALSRVQLATSFLNSAEFRTRFDARMSAFLLYATLLQRHPSPAELFTRTVQLAVTPISVLAQDFINSAEFQPQLQ